MSAPISLSDIFSGADSDEESTPFEQEYEVQTITINEMHIKIRQFSWHQANANQVWPGTYNLAKYIMINAQKYSTGAILELGSATGALAIYLNSSNLNFNVITTDIDDGGIVENNIIHNHLLNGKIAPIHIPYTWGEDWSVALYDKVEKKNIEFNYSSEDPSTLGDQLWDSAVINFRYVIASDILLYVRYSAYPALVKYLKVLFTSPNHSVVEFVMSWNRRIADSKIFFDLMLKEGFKCTHEGQCVYTFVRGHSVEELTTNTNAVTVAPV